MPCSNDATNMLSKNRSILGKLAGRRYLMLCTVGAILVIAVACLHGLNYAYWHISVLTAALGTMMLGAGIGSAGRHYVTLLIVSYWLVLFISALGDAVLSISPFQLEPRVSAWLYNSNLFGAALALTTIAGMPRIRNGYIRITYSTMGITAVALTGSRTAMVALIVGLVVTAFWAEWPLRTNRTVTVVALIALLATGLATIWQVSQIGPVSSHNLLQASSDLRHRAWIKGPHVEIIKDSSSLTPAGVMGDVFLLNIDSDESNTFLLHQAVGPGLSQVSYVASVYLRSDVSRSIILNTNYNSVACKVKSTWSRCYSPAVVGNGVTTIWLQLRADEPSDGIQIYVWGPQVEIGTAPTEAWPTHPSILSEIMNSGLFSRIKSIESTARELTSGTRTIAFSIAWSAFRSSPIIGIGRDNLNDQYDTWSKEERSPIRHAHNLFLQTLAELGLVGLAGHLLLFGTLIILAIFESKEVILPLVVTATLLNSMDYTLYNAGTFYLFWFSLGSVLPLKSLVRVAFNRG